MHHIILSSGVWRTFISHQGNQSVKDVLHLFQMNFQSLKPSPNGRKLLLTSTKPNGRKPVHLVRTRPTAATCVCPLILTASCHLPVDQLWHLSYHQVRLSSQDFGLMWRGTWAQAFVRCLYCATCKPSKELWHHHTEFCLEPCHLYSCEPQKGITTQPMQQIEQGPPNTSDRNCFCIHPWRCQRYHLWMSRPKDEGTQIFKANWQMRTILGKEKLAGQ